MWKQFIKNISKEYHFVFPASDAMLKHVKEQLKVELSQKLIDLYSETNGVFDEYSCPLIWSIEQMVEDNLFFRNFDEYKDIYMPFDNLLFFSDAGSGDLFAFAILNGSIQKGDIYVWNHEDDSRMWIASSLEEFIMGWITGEISV